MRSVRTVGFEAIVIGIINYMIYWIITTVGPKLNTPLILVMCGALIHLLFEYSPVGNLNKWWCYNTFYDHEQPMSG